jgi:drug/metabolite transporter (DMT)-like permease
MLIAAALLFSTGGAAVKSTSWNGWQTAGTRSLVAAIVLLLLLPEARKLGNWRVWLVGLAYSSCLVLFVNATKLTTSANAIFLQATAPLYILFLGPLLLREPLQRRDWACAGLLATGMYLLFRGSQQALTTAPNPSLGNLLAALSGLAWAVVLTGLRWQSRRSGDLGLATVAAGNLLAFAVCLLPSLPVPEAKAQDVGAILFLGIFQIGLAYWCLTRGMKGVPAFEASTILLIEPVANPVWTWLVQQEIPSAWSLAGGALILASTFARITPRRRDG